MCSAAPWFHISAPQGQQAPHTIDNCANLEMYISTRSGHQAHTENVSNLILVTRLENLIWLLHLVERLKCWVVVTRRRQVYYQSFYPFIAAFLHLSRINRLTVKRGVLGGVRWYYYFWWCFCQCELSQTWLIGLDWLIDFDGVGMLGGECRRRKKRIIEPTCRPAVRLLDLICTWYANARTGHAVIAARGARKCFENSPERNIF